jgi:hypothetical protein
VSSEQQPLCGFRGDNYGLYCRHDVHGIADRLVQLLNVQKKCVTIRTRAQSLNYSHGRLHRQTPNPGTCRPRLKHIAKASAKIEMKNKPKKLAHLCKPKLLARQHENYGNQYAMALVLILERRT